MKNILYIALFILSFTSCGSRQQKLPCEAWGCKSVEYDPNPLCRFEKKPTLSEILETTLSNDPWDLYEDGYEVTPPERHPFDYEPKVLPPESYVSPQCELTDEKAEKLACRGDIACLQKLTHWQQQQQQIQIQRQGEPYPPQQQQAQGGPSCFIFFCID